MKELVKIQTELKARKDLYNSFAKYAYRSAESILEALKPLLKETGCVVTLSDDIKEVELDGVKYKYKDGFLYDPTPHSVSVNVWYNKTTKKLETEVIYPDNKGKV